MYSQLRNLSIFIEINFWSRWNNKTILLGSYDYRKLLLHRFFGSYDNRKLLKQQFLGNVNGISATFVVMVANTCLPDEYNFHLFISARQTIIICI